MHVYRPTKISTHRTRAGLRALLMSVWISACWGNAPRAETGDNLEYELPLKLANAAALEAIRVCEASGWRVTATVVNASGVTKVMAKGDRSSIHTKDSSFRKAYTAVTMGPIFRFDMTGQWVKALEKNPNAAALASLPDIVLLPGGVAIRAHGNVVAAIGVGGAPGGDKDEMCALAGVKAIQAFLPN